MNESTHNWFREQIAAYIAGGLDDDETRRFEDHAQECASCAAELQGARQLENHMSSLFAASVPALDFEDRLIARLRRGAPRLRIHPAVRRASATAAAILCVATVGYFANEQIQRGSLPLVAFGSVDRPADTSRLGLATTPTGSIGYGDGWFNGEVDALRNGPALEPELAAKPAAAYDKRFTDTRRDLGYALRTPAQLADEVKQQLKDSSGNDGALLGTSFGQPGNRSAGEVGGGGGGNRQKSAPVAGAAIGTAVEKARQSLTEARSEPKAADYFSPHEYALSVGQDKAKAAETPSAGAQPQSQAQSIDRVALGKTALKTDAPVPSLQPAQQPAAQPAPASVGPSNPGPENPSAHNNAVSMRKVIRNGEMEFEVESFDNAFLAISKITAEEGGFVATTNSQKLTNGKVKGEIVVRVTPEHLDVLVLKLRALGDLKRQNLVAQDITKQYTDLDSQLRAAKAMQERLLEMIKSGQGAIKDLLAAEKELGVWREKIEKIEGEMRYYDSQVALSTLSISVYEKEIKSAAATRQSEQADVGIEADDVEKARADAITALDDAKGRIIESELKKFEAGQLAAKIVADVSADSAGGVIDRLKQLGKVARLEIQRKQTTPDGQAPLPGAKIERGDTRLVISLYNIANIAPRQTTNLTLACPNVEEVYATIIARIGKSAGRVVTSNINRDKPGQASAVVQFELKSADADLVLRDIESSGEVLRLTMSENPDTNNVTSAKRGFSLSLLSLDQVPPREVNQRSIASENVEKSYRALLNALAKLNARVLTNRLEAPGGGALPAASLEFEIRRDAAPQIEQALSEAGDAFDRNVSTSSDAENTSGSKVQYKLSIQNIAALPPRQTTTLAVEVKDVDRAVGDLQGMVLSVGGRVMDTTRSKEPSGQTIARVALETPYKNAADVMARARTLGVVRAEQISGNPQGPDSALARARFSVTLANADVIVASDHGLWATLRNGLSTSVVGLMWSLQLIVVGLCLIGPWVLALLLGWKFWKWSRRSAVPKPAA
jgi:hypothetical protein